MEHKNEAQQSLRRVLTLTKLKDLGVERVEINFSGSGDSGDIDEVLCLVKEAEDITNSIENFKPIENALADWAYDIIGKKVNTVGDWVNNEGGYGTIMIDVYDKSYTLNYHQRTTEDYDWSDEMLFI